MNRSSRDIKNRMDFHTPRQGSAAGLKNRVEAAAKAGATALFFIISESHKY
jgi:hypothetical protein